MKKQDLTKEQIDLLQKWANADATCSCLGHYKGQRNEWLRNKYATELREIHDIYVPKGINEWLLLRSGLFLIKIAKPNYFII